MTAVFITTPWFYPAFRAGGPVQSILNMINELNEGYEFYIFTSNADLNGILLKEIAVNQWIQYNTYVKVWYAGKGNTSNDLVHQSGLIKPDILYIVGLFSWYFNIVPLFFCKAPKKILSVRGMLHIGALHQKKVKKQLYMHAFKLLRRHKNVIFHATDADEKKQIEMAMGKDCDIRIAGNFPRALAKRKTGFKVPQKLRLITIALISPMKNYLLVLTALADAKSIIHYDIYGPVKDNAYWQQCLQQIKQLPPNIIVTFHGDISPELIQEKLHHAEVFIMPSKSENYGHSIIEALKAGLPVITSNYTPWNLLQENYAGINVSVTADDILNAIESFAEMDSETYNYWSDAATKYANSRINMQQLKNEYRELFSRESLVYST